MIHINGSVVLTAPRGGLSEGKTRDAASNVRFGSKADICRCNQPCPLYPRKRTLGSKADILNTTTMSDSPKAPAQKLASCVAFCPYPEFPLASIIVFEIHRHTPRCGAELSECVTSSPPTYASILEDTMAGIRLFNVHYGWEDCVSMGSGRSYRADLVDVAMMRLAKPWRPTPQ